MLAETITPCELDPDELEDYFEYMSLVEMGQANYFMPDEAPFVVAPIVIGETECPTE